MGILSKLMGKDEHSEAAAGMQAECGHGALVPRWDAVEDMGKEDKVSSYHCEGCNGDFTMEEAQRIRAQSSMPTTPPA